jgi:hypothetical protein
MKEFIEKYDDQIHGTFLFRSHVVPRISADYERLADGAVLQQFRNPISGTEDILLQNAERVKRHALYIAQQEGRPHQYLQ